jgi:hypothetical protein
VLEHVDRLEAKCLEQQQQLGYASAQMSQQSDLIDALRRVIAGLERDRDTSNNSNSKQKDTNREFIARRLQRAATFAGTGIVSSSSSANNGGNAATSSSITDGIALAKRQSTGQLNSSSTITSSGMPPPFPHSMSSNRLEYYNHIYFNCVLHQLRVA